MNHTPPLFSIIIPVYNSINYIERCINSILGQTFADYEIVIVDDGSYDGSSEICKRFMNEDNRVIYLHQDNSGVSAARNLGLDHASGEWITFVDSDDYLLHSHLDEIKKIIQINTIGKLCMFTHQQESKVSEHISNIKIYEGSISEMKEHLKSQVWNYFFTREIIDENKIRFDINYRYAEDVLFLCQYLSYVKHITIIDSLSYVYNDLNISATTHINCINNEDHLNVAEQISTIKNCDNYVKEKFIYDLTSRYIYILCKNKDLKLRKKINIFNSKHKIISGLLNKYKYNKTMHRRIIHAFPFVMFIKYLI